MPRRPRKGADYTGEIRPLGRLWASSFLAHGGPHAIVELCFLHQDGSATAAELREWVARSAEGGSEQHRERHVSPAPRAHDADQSAGADVAVRADNSAWEAIEQALDVTVPAMIQAGRGSGTIVQEWARMFRRALDSASVPGEAAPADDAEDEVGVDPPLHAHLARPLGPRLLRSVGHLLRGEGQRRQQHQMVGGTRRRPRALLARSRITPECWSRRLARIPVGQAIRAFRKRLGETCALRDGQLVCIFPEGRITDTGELYPFRGGIKRIIDRTPVPVVPTAEATSRAGRSPPPLRPGPHRAR